MRFDVPRNRDAPLLEMDDEVVVMFRATEAAVQDRYSAKVMGVYSTKDEAAAKDKELLAESK